MPKPKLDPNAEGSATIVNLRFPHDLIAALDAFAAQLAAKSGGLAASRSDAVRVLCREGLTARRLLKKTPAPSMKSRKK